MFIKKYLTSVLKSSFSYVTSEDFEFIKVNGKKSSVPLCKEGQEFMGKVVKEIADRGSVYIRLTKPPQYTLTVIQVLSYHLFHLGVGGTNEDKGVGGTNEDEGVGGTNENQGVGGTKEDRVGGTKEDRVGGTNEEEGVGDKEVEKVLVPPTPSSSLVPPTPSSSLVPPTPSSSLVPPTPSSVDILVGLGKLTAAHLPLPHYTILQSEQGSCCPMVHHLGE